MYALITRFPHIPPLLPEIVLILFITKLRNILIFLIILGLIFVYGKGKALILLKKHLNNKVFKYLKINKIFKKIDEKNK